MRDEEAHAKLDEILSLLRLVRGKQRANQEHTMAEIDDLKAQVAAQQTVDQSAITLLQGLKSQLDAALAAGDDSALRSQVESLSQQLGTENQALANAVTANTPAASSTTTTQASAQPAAPAAAPKA